MDRRQFLAAGSSLLLLGTSLRGASAQSAPAVPSHYPADYSKIIEGSKAEKKLLIYGNMSADAWKPVMTRFSKLYPWIEVEALDIESSELIERYLAENGTGSRTADFLVSNAMEGWLNLLERKQLLEYRSPETDKLPAQATPGPGVYAIAVDSQLLIWNKLLLAPDMVPTGLSDLAAKVKANPEMFRGKITTYAPDSSATGLQSHYAYVKKHGEKAWESLDILAPIIRGERSNGPILEKVISGEYLVGYHILPGNVWLAMKKPAMAAVVGWKFHDDGTFLNLRGAGITKAATNVNAAKLLLDVILSHEGQIAMAAGGRTPIRPDVKPEDVGGSYTYASVAKEVGEDNLMIVPYNKTFSDERGAFLERWKKALRS